MSFRRTLFWIHLVAGLISGLAIAVMCFTGTLLAFEKDLIAWAERDARQIATPPAGATRLPLAEMQARLRAAQPEARPNSLVLQNNPLSAVAFTTGRTGGYYVNPYTGDVRQPQSTGMVTFMRVMTEWHRYLGLQGAESRPVGKLINGICNLAFCALALTGLYLWMPRRWSWHALRPVVWFRQNESARARDFNWHNAIGFWTAPVLIVLTLTAVPISFRWGGTLINTLTGTAAVGQGPGGRGGAPGQEPAVAITAPAAGATALSLDALIASVQQAVPAWKTITLRLANADQPGSAGARSPNGEGRRDGGAPARTAAAASFTVRESTSWPRTATSTLTVDPFTGAVLRRTGYADMNAAQQVRSWTRFLHTGEALGWGGQFIAGLACLGGLFLVYTGFALSWRRFFGRKPVAPDAAARSRLDADPAVAGTPR